MLDYILPILLGLCVVGHIWMMFRGHGHNGGHKDCEEMKESKKNNESNHSCCH